MSNPQSPTLQNYTYDEITIGQTASFTKTLREDDLVLFAEVSGDVNPVHLDAELINKTTKIEARIVNF